MFRPVEGQVKFPKLEARISKFWDQHEIYEKSLEQRNDAERFVFYEGPPTANGLPHPGHCLTRAMKDLFPRYRTMRGQYCQRKAGWDTHGLPVEVEVCKELGIHSKEEIETFGIEPFIHRCVESVFRYTRQWEELTRRLGFWIHLDEAYVTYHQSYVESVWWALKQLLDQGLLYQGHKIVWWWAQGGTALSAGEVGQGYREVADPSVYVRFPLLDQPDTDLLVWTTTPWTLPSNMFAAVHPDLDYAVVQIEGEKKRLIIAAALVETIAKKIGQDLTVLSTCPGSQLVGRRYMPPFDFYHASQGQQQAVLRNGEPEYLNWRVVAADFVTIESGTGVVHQAPAFGEVDYEVLQAEQARFAEGQGPSLLCAVGPDGKFTSEAAPYEGRWVKEADKDISRELRRRGLLLHQEQYLHEYPFCWRADEDPLIQYPRLGWFIRTTRFKDKMLANNQHINWLPEHIKDGRFGNFLESNVDWALSRERYWGTPLPIWVCEATGQIEAIDSYAALMEKPDVQGTEVWEQAHAANPDLPDDLKVHKPYIDAVTYESPHAPQARMRRVAEVIDCWFDSGAMPFAQWGYPHQGQDRFVENFPADFISEALDQTRGWFYSQLAISTMLFSQKDSWAAREALTDGVPSPHPFRNCIVLGLMLGEDGQKMSKSKRNYREPGEILDKYGADALRWYFFANQPPWSSIRYSERAIKESIPDFLLRLWNCFSFLVIYANIDGFDPAERLSGEAGQLDPVSLGKGQGYRPLSQRGELDRWILSELHGTAAEVTQRMDAFDNFNACSAIRRFVDALSNWYVRRSRDRFWSGQMTDAKLDAYWTLYECLTTTAKIVAPFVPFLAEAIWQHLVAEPFGQRATQSVHLCDYPTGQGETIDQTLSDRMAVLREIASQGRGARMAVKLKVRQPLSKVEVILADDAHRSWLAEHAALIREELNVKEVEFTLDAQEYVTYEVRPDLKRLGPRLGKQVGPLKQALAKADPAVLVANLQKDGNVTLDFGAGPITLDEEDILIGLQAREGWAAAQGPSAVVVLSTELTDDLIAEGLARELIHAVQNLRKQLDCEYTDRIHLALVTEDESLRHAAEQFADYLKEETLATELTFEPLEGSEPAEVKIGGSIVQLHARVVNPAA